MHAGHDKTIAAKPTCQKRRDRAIERLPSLHPRGHTGLPTCPASPGGGERAAVRLWRNIGFRF